MDYRETIIWKEISVMPDIFSVIREKNAKVMAELVEKIKNTKVNNFITAGRGSSDNAVLYFKYVLEVLTNYTVGSSAPSIITLYKGKTNYSNSIVLGCSQSGMAEDVLEVIKKGNEQGAITIAITGNEDSPVAKAARFPIITYTGEYQAPIAINSFSAQMFVFLWLASELAGKKDYLMLLKHLDKVLKHVFPQIDELTTVYSEKLKNTKVGFVLSRGFNYPIALELSLLLQETCHMKIAGYASSDFYHGPLAMVNKNTPVIMFCGKYDGDEEIQSIIRADQIRCVEKVLSLSASAYLVTNDCLLTGRFRRCNDALIDFSLPEEFSVFVFAVFAQMLACKSSCLLGNNPDDVMDINVIWSF